MDYNIKISKYGDKYYYINNLLHREDGPAVEFIDGSKFWYVNNRLHREDGPAIEYSNGGKGWFLNHKCYGVDNKFTNESWKKFIKTLIFS